MLIIDERATETLLHTLTTFSDFQASYCVQFFSIESSKLQPFRQAIIAKAQAHFFMNNPQVYFCDDGVSYVLVEQAGIRECRKMLLDVANVMSLPIAENIGRIYELSSELGAFVLPLRKQAEQRRLKEEGAEHVREQAAAKAQLEKRRHFILEQLVTESVQEIHARRVERSEAVVMMIEDDPFSRRLVENVVQQQYKMVSLESAEKALRTYAAHAPDILFLDINLPDVTGHELLEKLMVIDPNSFIIMLSGSADKENVMQALGRGARGFVAKPFSRDKLFQYIDRCPTIRKTKAL